MNLDFEKYLESTGISAKSIKNYKSDISQFLAWAKLKLKDLGAYAENILEMSPFLTSEFVAEYLSHLINNKLPRKTINRRLSTLRHLSRFLTSSQVIDSDFMSEIQNITDAPALKISGISSHPSVSEFKAFLEAEKISKNTIKNYLSDIRQFLNWLESNHARFT
jgi:site-specific recombinase XerD